MVASISWRHFYRAGLKIRWLVIGLRTALITQPMIE
jgi:hypothetical protein